MSRTLKVTGNHAMYDKKLLEQLLDSVFVISRIIKVSVRVGYQPQPSASVDNPYLGLDHCGVSQKLHPMIAYKQINSFLLYDGP